MVQIYNLNIYGPGIRSFLSQFSYTGSKNRFLYLQHFVENPKLFLGKVLRAHIKGLDSQKKERKGKGKRGKYVDLFSICAFGGGGWGALAN